MLVTFPESPSKFFSANFQENSADTIDSAFELLPLLSDFCELGFNKLKIVASDLVCAYIALFGAGIRGSLGKSLADKAVQLHTAPFSGVAGDFDRRWIESLDCPLPAFALGFHGVSASVYAGARRRQARNGRIFSRLHDHYDPPDMTGLMAIERNHQVPRWVPTTHHMHAPEPFPNYFGVPLSSECFQKVPLEGYKSVTKSEVMLGGRGVGIGIRGGGYD